MDISDEAKEIVQALGEAINESVGNSPGVLGAIERLREAGYELELTLKLEIGLRRLFGPEGGERATGELALTDDDLNTLRGMRIKID